MDELREAYERGRSRWPGVVVAFERYVEFVIARCAAIVPPRADQLYLTCACVAGDAVAVAAFERAFGPTIDAALARMAAQIDADEVRQRVLARLFVGDGEVPPRIGEYTGRGELEGWVRAVAVRTGLNYRRSHRREAPDEDADELAALLPATGGDPELAALLERYRAEVGAALAEALHRLSDQARATLRYHYAERLSIAQIGAIVGVHKTTAFRRLEAARAELVDAARDALKRRLQVDDAGLVSIVRAVSSHMDLTLSGYFRDHA